MVPEIKREWIDALLSDEYPQATGALRSNVGFCCLGVLCDIAIKHGVVNPWKPTGNHLYAIEVDGVDVLEIGLPPAAVMEWAGLEYRGGEYGERVGDRGASYLAGDNDSGKTFSEIAKIIEENF